jgi:hypothetical protein
MKTRYKRRVCKFRLTLPSYDSEHSIKMALKLETALARKPRVLHLEMIGDGEVPADIALLIRSMLLNRSPAMEIVTNARSSLQGGSVLVWLLGGSTHHSRRCLRIFQTQPLGG